MRLRLLLFIVLAAVLTFSAGFKYYSFGGEIPWPLSSQHVVTMTNSRGLWKLDNKDSSMIFNVEIVSRDSGYDWIRVSELDPESYTVLSWGEGFFRTTTDEAEDQSSFSDIYLDKEAPQDRYGRYIYMFPNGDLNQSPYLIRLVEVETQLGYVLGLSIINLIDKDFEHYLGVRLHTEPLNCVEHEKKIENLSCFLP